MRYSFIVNQVEVEGELYWVAKSNELEHCVGQGKTLDEALKELEENEAVWIEMAEEDGETIPIQNIKHPLNYSGKFTVRISKSLHKQASERAELEKVSLNAFVEEAIAEKVGNIPKQDIVSLGNILKDFGMVVQKTGGVLQKTQVMIYDVSEITNNLAKNYLHMNNWGFDENQYSLIRGEEICN